MANKKKNNNKDQHRGDYKIEIDIICDKCKRFVKTIEKDTFDIHHKDYCERCKNENR